MKRLPTANSATNITQNGFTANWTSVSGITEYHIDVSTSSTFSTFLSGFNNQNVYNSTSLNISQILQSGTNYYYRVRGYVNGTSSANSNTVNVLTVPGTPTGLSSSNISASGFTAVWNIMQGSTNYYLDVSTNSSFTSYVAGYQNYSCGNVSSKQVSGISSGTTYYFRLRAANSSGTSVSTSPVSVITLPNAPTANLATNITQNGFTANWTSVSGITEYHIDVSTSSTFSTFLSGFNNQNVYNSTSLNISQILQSGTNYYYRVRGYLNGTSSANSNTVNVLTVPGTPTGLSSSNISASGFTAVWNIMQGATNYYLDVSTNSSFTSYVAGYQNYSCGNVSSKQVSGISSGTTYYFRLRAANSSGTSVSTSPVSVITLPTAPVATSATNITQSSFTANWSSVPGATEYHIDVSTSSTFSTFLSGYNNNNVYNSTSLNVSPLAGGSTYYYRVRAYIGGVTSVNSNSITVVTMPGTPTGLYTTDISANGFTAGWNAMQGATNYYLDVSTNSSFTSYVTGYQNYSCGNVSSKQVSGISSGTTYYFRLRAANSSGASVSTSPVSVITLPDAPDLQSPSDQTSFGVGTQVTLTWQSVASATNYWLQLSKDGSVVDISSLGNVTSYEIPSNFLGTSPATFTWKVRAYNASGWGNYSSLRTFNCIDVPLPDAPVLIAPINSVNVEGTEISFSWEAVAGATDYQLQVSASSGFETIFKEVYTGTNTNTSVSEFLDDGTAFYWRVRTKIGADLWGTEWNSGIFVNGKTSMIIKNLPYNEDFWSFNDIPIVNNGGININFSGLPEIIKAGEKHVLKIDVKIGDIITNSAGETVPKDIWGNGWSQLLFHVNNENIEIVNSEN
jgi:uncharacterized protein YegP (UPF0339 family)